MIELDSDDDDDVFVAKKKPAAKKAAPPPPALDDDDDEAEDDAPAPAPRNAPKRAARAATTKKCVIFPYCVQRKPAERDGALGAGRNMWSMMTKSRDRPVRIVLTLTTR
jgi:hypothetical protein